ncbi:MAG: hypothetical protein KGD63_09405 [Candidatus Lokiarchaeota archaeon]|nr:hypothetical protein [Candidatus Lokiarchaeota archaeon]
MNREKGEGVAVYLFFYHAQFIPFLKGGVFLSNYDKEEKIKNSGIKF